jgi:hypothetical protein
VEKALLVFKTTCHGIRAALMYLAQRQRFHTLHLWPKRVVLLRSRKRELAIICSATLPVILTQEVHFYDMKII